MQEPGNFHRGALMSSYALALSSMVATLFLAYQAWLARSAYMEATESRFVEKKMEICFENFDAAALLDGALNRLDPTIASQDWPPIVQLNGPASLATLKQTVVPQLNKLEGSLTKASALGGLDKYRGYLAQQLRGLSKSVSDLAPADVGAGAAPESVAQVDAILRQLSDLLGAQYSVFTGCRLIAEGQA